MKISSNLVVVVSFIIDILDVILSLIVAILSGSVIMLSQVLGGVSDLLSSGFLLVGLIRSKQKEDRDHPFGYGRELYFWALLSGIVMLTVTVTLSIFFGWQRFVNPEIVHNLYLAFGVLGLTLVTNGVAFYLSFKRLLRNRSIKHIINIFLRSSLIETKTTFILDFMGMSASLLGIISLFIYKITGNSQFDGLGAIVIGVVLAFLAVMLLLGTVDLITGRSASIEVEDRIRKAALKVPKVNNVLGLKTLHIGSERLLVNLDVHLQHNLTTDEIEDLIDKIKDSIKKEIPQVKHIQVELETPPEEELAKNS